MDIPGENPVNDFPSNHARSFFSNRVLILIAAILLVLIAALVAVKYLPKTGGATQSSDGTMPFSGIVLPGKPALSGSIVDNPDFNFTGYGWLYSPPAWRILADRTTFNESTRWEGTGWVSNSTYGGRTGIILMHPVTVSEGTYVNQTVVLPTGKTYYLVFGLANLAGYFGPTGCDDNIFKVSIIDANTGSTEVLFNGVLNAKDGWKDYMISISKYAGKEITIRVDSLAGGPCGMWAGEWGSLDYVDVLSSAI